MKTSVPLNYAPPPLPKKSRIGFAIASTILATIGGVIAHWFHAGVFDNYKYGDDWIDWSLLGLCVSIASIVCAAIGLIGRRRALAVIAIVLSIAVFIYGITSPIPRNVPLP